VSLLTRWEVHVYARGRRVLVERSFRRRDAQEYKDRHGHWEMSDPVRVGRTRMTWKHLLTNIFAPLGMRGRLDEQRREYQRGGGSD
jgi:hypothetical protein